MISERVGHALDPAVLWTYRLLFRNSNISPNSLSILGFLFGAGSAVAVATARPVIGALLLLVAGFFDLLDGTVARTTGKITRFGGFLDSVLDRYTDLLATLGAFLFFLKQGNGPACIVTFVAAIGIALVPYARARAEAASFECRRGLLERPERTILLIVGLLFNILFPVMVVLAVMTHVTVVQRILHVRRQADAGGPEEGSR